LRSGVEALVPGEETHDDHHDKEEQMQTLQDVQTWRGMKMVDADGDKIGTIEDILLDRHTGEPAWAAVKTGLFGLKHTLVPIRDAEVAGDNEVRVPFEKDQVKDAPRIDPDGELSPEEERQLWEHYGLSDYDEWQGEDRTRALALPDEDADRARRSGSGSEAGDGEPVIVGVRLRRVVLVAGPADEQESGQGG
jgi:sporulation protein YlmC with PRC-barrel domain